MLHVSYAGANNPNEYMAILNNPPRIRTYVGHIVDLDFKSTNVPYKITIEQAVAGDPSGSGTMQVVSGILNLHKAEERIIFDVHAVRKNEYGWINIEDKFTTPLGNIYGVTKEGYLKGVNFADRKTNFGALGIKANA